MKFCVVLTLLCAAATTGFGLDRQAFTITRYQLAAQIDRPTHVMAITGELTLRNDSKTPQKILTLQITSSFEWNIISLDGEPLQWLSENYTSDVDHTGSLTEAIVTLPKPVPSGGAVTVAVQYGGTIASDATRLTRMGTPVDIATRSDWDEISDSFTAVRGLGYVVWYPVAIEAVSMSDGNAVFDAIAAWKSRHQHSQFSAQIVLTEAPNAALCIAMNSSTSACGQSKPIEDVESAGNLKEFSNAVTLDGMGESVPTFAIADYVELSRPTIALLHLAAHTSLARDYAVAAEASDPLLKEWLGEPRDQVRVIELTEPNALPYQSGSILFTPLRSWPTDTLQLLLMPAQVSARFHAPHLWIEEGLQRFLQAISVESRSGRKAALEYLDQLREPLVKSEEATHPKGASQASVADNTLLNTNDELYLRGKGSFVFWMLRDMLGDASLQSALAKYRAGADKDPSYFQRLLQTGSKRDVEWFFDDWVYRDRGLPDFHVDSTYARPLLGEGSKNFLTTVTIENRGRTGAEVPVLVHTPAGEKTVRVLVKAGEKGTGRVEVPVAPDKIIVNDGSVPEADTESRTYKIPLPQ